jgi:glutathione S-transferase
MKIHGFPPSPNTWKCRAVAAHLGLPLELDVVDITKGANRQPAYLKLNPTGRTPTLVDGDFVIWESNAIMQYLAGRSKNALWPDDAAKRADIMRWQSYQIAHWSKVCEPILFEGLVKQILGLGPPDTAAIAAAEAALAKEGPVLDAHLAGRKFLCGDDVTLADFAVGSYLVYADRAQMKLAPYPNLVHWKNAVIGLPAWGKSAPPM